MSRVKFFLHVSSLFLCLILFIVSMSGSTRPVKCDKNHTDSSSRSDEGGSVLQNQGKRRHPSTECTRRVISGSQSVSPSVVSPRKKRLRNFFSKKQLDILKLRFQAQNFLTFEEKNTLAVEVGLDRYQVQIWFQNKRQKEKGFLEKQEDVNKEVLKETPQSVPLFWNLSPVEIRQASIREEYLAVDSTDPDYLVYCIPTSLPSAGGDGMLEGVPLMREICDLLQHKFLCNEKTLGLLTEEQVKDKILKEKLQFTFPLMDFLFMEVERTGRKIDSHPPAYLVYCMEKYTDDKKKLNVDQLIRAVYCMFKKGLTTCVKHDYKN